MQNLIKTIRIPIPINEAWEFFSSPANLKLITPQYMGFDITSENAHKKMYRGMIITYKVKPVLNIPVEWVTEITQVDEPFYFVDNQKSGPYKFWHHQHLFKETKNGTEMTDIVNYAAPFGFVGKIAENLFIKKKVEEIFNFRNEKMNYLFNR